MGVSNGGFKCKKSALFIVNMSFLCVLGQKVPDSKKSLNAHLRISLKRPLNIQNILIEGLLAQVADDSHGVKVVEDVQVTRGVGRNAR
jgi:hypothetical protein